MPQPIIEISEVSKKYRLGVIGARSLREEAENFLGRLRKKGANRLDPKTFWALRGVSFAVASGEVIGIIGRNGAGKSTLLKILSRITRPTSGEITIRGRLASLLEVGTGFHPDLTGAENVYLNGAMLGMSRAEIARKFDEIVAFAAVEKFLDTPVKRYSSGMYVRLAFAVAAHLEPEILIIDEVLAVGDAEFQKKCLGKMQDVARNKGRTILFVSHNIAAVRQLTTRAAVLRSGELHYFGPTEQAIDAYHKDIENMLRKHYPFQDTHRKWPGTGTVGLVAGSFTREVPIFAHEEDIDFEIQIASADYAGPLRLSLTLYTGDGVAVGGSFGEEFPVALRGHEPRPIHAALRAPALAPGRYYFDLAIGRGNHLTQRTEFDIVGEVLHFEVSPPVTGAGVLSRWERGWGNVLFPPLACTPG